MNNKTFIKKTKAFSLIELAIVLIIIGLLVAGVTGGASLIKNAELRGVMGEARGYQTAVYSFNAKFDALPGDYGTQIGSSGNGDGDGTIEFVNNNTGATNRMEGNIAWRQLSNGLFIDAFTVLPAADAASAVSYTQNLTPGTGATSGANIPGSKFKSLGWIFDYVGSQNVVIATAAITADMTLVDATAQAAVPTAILVPADALSIDTKTDDGVGNTGKVRGTITGCQSSGTYTTGTTTAACALSFQVDPDV